MISFEELRQRFQVRNIAPYGECVVVPGAEFDPDWEVYLAKEGCACVNTDLDQRPVTLVWRKPMGEGVRDVYVPVREEVESLGEDEQGRLGRWSREDELRLLRRMSELQGTLDEKVKALQGEFPGRSAAALLLKWRKLQRKAGRSLVGDGWGKTAKADVEKAAAAKVDMEKPVEGGAAEAVQKMNGLGEVATLLRDIRDFLRPKSFCFEYACACCGYCGSADDQEKIWRFCPICGERLSVWDVEASE